MKQFRANFYKFKLCYESTRWKINKAFNKEMFQINVQSMDGFKNFEIKIKVLKIKKSRGQPVVIC